MLGIRKIGIYVLVLVIGRQLLEDAEKDIGGDGDGDGDGEACDDESDDVSAE